VHKNTEEYPPNFVVIKTVLKWIAGIAAVLIASFLILMIKTSMDTKVEITTNLAAHDARIIKVETTLQFLTEDIKEIKSLTKDIRNDQVRRQDLERPPKAKVNPR
jgi:hypothetical protein